MYIKLTQQQLFYTQTITHYYLCFSKVPQSEVQSPQIVKDLRGDVSLYLLLENTCGCAVCRQSTLYKEEVIRIFFFLF